MSELRMESSTPMMDESSDGGEEQIIPCPAVYHTEDIGAQQTYVHEYCGSTEPALPVEGRHDHRFAGVTGEAIYVPGSHVHRIETRTDYRGHFHWVKLISGPAAFPPEGSARQSGRMHVHFIESRTAGTDGHWHGLVFATLAGTPETGGDGRNRG